MSRPKRDPVSLLTTAIQDTVREELAAIDWGKISGRLEVVRPDSSSITIDGGHRQAGTVARAVAAGVHVLLVGPAGTGKTYLAQTIAEALGRKYFSTSLCEATTKGDLLGIPPVGGVGYVKTPFRLALEEGAIWIADELDATPPGILVLLNSALSGSPIAFPDGAIITPGPDFAVIATANTWGQGGNSQYTARSRLDASTLSRFAGIELDYDDNLERQCLGLTPIYDLLGDPPTGEPLTPAQIHSGVKRLRQLSMSGDLPPLLGTMRQALILDRLSKAGFTSSEALKIAVIKGADPVVRNRVTSEFMGAL